MAFAWIIFTLTFFYGCIEDSDTSTEDQPKIAIIDAEITEFQYDQEYNETLFKFNYELSWVALPSDNEVVKYSIKFIKDSTIYAKWESIEYLSSESGSGAGSEDADIDGIQPIPDRYKVEVYWQNELVDELEKDYQKVR